MRRSEGSISGDVPDHHQVGPHWEDTGNKYINGILLSSDDLRGANVFVAIFISKRQLFGGIWEQSNLPLKHISHTTFSSSEEKKKKKHFKFDAPIRSDKLKFF